MNRMKWYDWMQYGALLLVALTIPVAWRWALWASLLFATVTLVGVVARRRVGNPALGWLLRVALCGPIVYWLVLAASLLWSTDLVTGWEVLRLKAVLLIFPLCFLISDTSYLTRNHLRAVGYAFLVAVCGAFLYFLVKAGVSMLQGTDFVTFKNGFYSHERAVLYHHAYIALYAVVAMLFAYHELSTHWRGMKWWHRCLVIVSLPLLVCYTVLVNSRAGMLAMGLTALVCVVHLMVTHRSWKLGVAIGLLAVASIVAATQLMPGYVNRISSTVKNVEKDARTSINRVNWHTYVKQPVVGYGVGDYHAAQVEQYEVEEFAAGIKAEYNAHNQYMESLLAAGIPGLLAFLFFMLTPLYTALRGRSRHLFLLAVLTGIVMFNLLFESMLERQMGLLAIGLLFAVMVLIMSVEENKFARLEKS